MAKPIFRVLLFWRDNKLLAPVRGSAVTIPGWEKYKFFVSKPIRGFVFENGVPTGPDYAGGWIVISADTGLAIGNSRDTRREAIESAQNILSRQTEATFNEAVASAHKQHKDAEVVEFKKASPKIPTDDLDSAEAVGQKSAILTAIPTTGSAHIDVKAEKTGLGVARASQLLTALALVGRVKEGPGNSYSRTPTSFPEHEPFEWEKKSASWATTDSPRTFTTYQHDKVGLGDIVNFGAFGDRGMLVGGTNADAIVAPIRTKDGVLIGFGDPVSVKDSFRKLNTELYHPTKGEIEVIMETREKAINPEAAASTQVEKEPWEMTQEEFLSYHKIKPYPRTSHRKRNNTIKWHKRVVEDAAKEGKQISESVLQEYPAIAQEYFGWTTKEPSATSLRVDPIAVPPRQRGPNDEVNQTESIEDQLLRRAGEGNLSAYSTVHMTPEEKTTLKRLVRQGKIEKHEEPVYSGAGNRYRYYLVVEAPEKMPKKPEEKAEGKLPAVSELRSIEESRSPRSRESDERQSNILTVEPDDPRVSSWERDPGRMDISGIDTPRKPKAAKGRSKKAKKPSGLGSGLQGLR